MALQLTAVFRKVPEGNIGFVEELPGANTQAPTLEEARQNLREAALMVVGKPYPTREPVDLSRSRGE